MSTIETAHTAATSARSTGTDTTGMTITGLGALPEFGLVAHDLYRDIHKGIRAELFAVTGEAGRLDVRDRSGRAALAAQVSGVVALLVAHADHEDGAIQPALEEHLPVLAEIVAEDHRVLEDRMATLVEMSSEAVDAAALEHRARLHHLYLELSSFTAAYLRHQDVEERVIMPSLESTLGVPAVIAVHEQILAGIAPQEMAQSLAVMLPAMNLEDRVEMLGGMQANAPAEVFEGVWNLAGSVLDAADRSTLARRLAAG